MAKGKRRQITLEDVARHLGISKATVSLALNNSPLVAHSTKIRVTEAAEALGYRPNYFAANLSKGKSDVIGLFILEGEEGACNWALSSSWMFYNPILKSVVSTLSQKGYRLQLEVISIDGATNCGVLAHSIQDGSLDGILLLVQDDLDYKFLSIAQRMQFPLVVMNAQIDLDISSVRTGNELGASRVVEYLVDLGHTKIAHIGGPERDLNALERKSGFLRAMSAANLNVSGDYVKLGDWQIQSGSKLARDLMALNRPPTAICCANDHMAVGAIRTLQQLGYKVPEDVSVVGYDDTEMCVVVTPNLTTVRQSLEEMGEASAREVLRQIEEGTVSTRRINLEPELVIRHSVSPIA
jgi:LacI family transcriptional regulator